MFIYTRLTFVRIFRFLPIIHISILFFLVGIILIQGKSDTVLAQTTGSYLPDFTVVKSDIYGLTDFRRPGLNDNATETPTMVLTEDNWKDYLIPSSTTIKCRLPLQSQYISSSKKGINFANQDCKIGGLGQMYTDMQNFFTPRLRRPEDMNKDDWIRNYAGIFGVHLVPGNPTKKILLITHGENCNYKCTDRVTGTTYYYQNTINGIPATQVANTCMASSVINPEADKVSNETISWSYINYDPNLNWSKADVVQGGPIAWPALGFVRSVNGQLTKVSDGVRHPRSIIKDGYLYVYYTDQSRPTWEEHNQGYEGWHCLKVARAQLGSDGLPGKFYVYFRGNFSEEALPAGFTNENIRNYYGSYGPKGSCLFGQGSEDQFAVAKVRGTPYYAAVRAYSRDYNGQANKFLTSIKLSKDLVNWGPDHVLVVADNWTLAYINYPIFLDKAGTTNVEIDHNGFYINGTKGYSGYQPTAMDIALNFIPPADKIDQFINQYFNEFLGRNAGDTTYQKNMMSQSGCKGVIQNISRSSEFTEGRQKTLSNEEYVRMLFRGILSRNPEVTDGGYQWYLTRLASGGFTRDTIIGQMVDIPEAATACGEGKLLTSIPPSTSIPTPTPQLGDINGDGVVNIQDYQLLSNSFGKSSTDPGFNSAADLNKDNTVNIQDYQLLSNNYGK